MEELLSHIKILNERLELMQEREHGPPLSDRVMLTKIANEIRSTVKHLNELRPWML